MERITRRSINIQIGKILDRECSKCPMKKLGKTYKPERQRYCAKECPIGQDLQELSSLLITDEKQGKPKPEDKPISDLNINGRWTEGKDFYLMNHYQVYPLYHLAKRLHCSPKRVQERLDTLLNTDSQQVSIS